MQNSPREIGALPNGKDLSINCPYGSNDADHKTSAEESDDDCSLACLHLEFENHRYGNQNHQEVAD